MHKDEQIWFVLPVFSSKSCDSVKEVVAASYADQAIVQQDILEDPGPTGGYIDAHA